MKGQRAVSFTTAVTQERESDTELESTTALMIVTVLAVVFG